MAIHLLPSVLTISLILLIPLILLIRRAATPSRSPHDLELDRMVFSTELTPLTSSLSAALPEDIVILPSDIESFKKSMRSCWAQQEMEVIPACSIRPRNTEELSKAMIILKKEFDERGTKDYPDGLFAVRSGGHSALRGASSVKGGVLIDLSCFKQVIPAEDRGSVVVGAGAKWIDVSTVLDEIGLAVTGGRNADVGVGGLTLGGESLFPSTGWNTPLPSTEWKIVPTLPFTPPLPFNPPPNGS